MADENVKYDLIFLDEIVFENRNKEYGAYDLRHQYPNCLQKSFYSGQLSFFWQLSPFIYLKIQQMNAKEKTEVNANW
jgi:protein TonB